MASAVCTVSGVACYRQPESDHVYTAAIFMVDCVACYWWTGSRFQWIFSTGRWIYSVFYCFSRWLLWAAGYGWRRVVDVATYPPARVN